MHFELKLEDLESVRSMLTPDQREELLESLLVAASYGGDRVVEVLEALCLVYGVEDLMPTQDGSC